MDKKIKLGITEWSLPVDGPYGCKIAAEIGFEGIQLDVGSYERNFPKTKKVAQDAYLEAAEKFGIIYTAIACNELDNFNMDMNSMLNPAARYLERGPPIFIKQLIN
jgi:sugar phosphate isomerase/epimerase